MRDLRLGGAADAVESPTGEDENASGLQEARIYARTKRGNFRQLAPLVLMGSELCV